MALNFLSGSQITGPRGLYVSALQTGTGSAQTIAHTMGRTPTKVIAIWQGTGTWSVTYGTSTSTDFVLTAGSTCTYVILAW